MCPQNRFFGFHSAPVWAFLRKKLQNRIWDLIFHRKSYTHFIKCAIPRKMIMHSKNYFMQLFLIKNIQNLSPCKKGNGWFLLPDASFPSKWPCPPTNGFSQFFQCKLKNIYEVLLLENILVRKKILWRTSSPGKLRFAQKCILGEWLYNVTKGVGRVYSVSKSSIGCSKVWGNDFQCGVKPLSGIICLIKWGAL